MPIYWINIDVHFINPMITMRHDSVTDNKKSKGFIQTYGCTTTSEKCLKGYIEKNISDEKWLANNVKCINYDYIGTIDSNRIKDEIYADEDICDELIQDVDAEGIWYISGRGFYYDTDDDDESFSLVEIEEL